jgi:phage shock protein A
VVATTAATAFESMQDVIVTTKPKSAQAVFETMSTKSEPAEEVFETATHKTPAPAPVSESVFQSGVRSVKRLLWRAS